MKESPAPNEEDRGTRSRNQGRTFPLFSDFKQRKVVKDYDIFNEAQGFGSRATFVIDKEGANRPVRHYSDM